MGTNDRSAHGRRRAPILGLRGQAGSARSAAASSSSRRSSASTRTSAASPTASRRTAITSSPPAIFDRAERGVDLGYEQGRRRARPSASARRSASTQMLLDIAACGRGAEARRARSASSATASAARSPGSPPRGWPGFAATVGYYGGMIAANSAKAALPGDASFRRGGRRHPDGRRRRRSRPPSIRAWSRSSPMPAPATPSTATATPPGTNHRAKLARERTLAFLRRTRRW